MEARASTYTASKLGALAVTTKPMSDIRRSQGVGKGEGGTYVSRLHMVKWKSRGGRTRCGTGGIE